MKNPGRYRRVLLLVLWLTSHAMAAVDAALPDYQRVEALAGGTLTATGSDTLNNLVSVWAEDFGRFYPQLSVQVQATGSASAPAALTAGTASIGPMSRRMSDSEIRRFESRYGYPPLAVPVAIDMLAVYVNHDNPLPGLTLQQLDAIFSASRRCGAAQAIRYWGQLGLGGGWQHRSVSVYSRNAASGTYDFFREQVLCRGDFQASVNEQAGSASVVQAVGASVNAIGYAGIGYRSASVRALPLAAADGNYYPPTPENALAGQYPLARFLYLYVNRHPQHGLNPAEREFIRMVLSRQGQQAVVQAAYVPLPAAMAAQWLDKLAGEP